MADGEAPSPTLRASDAERERTATTLREHTAAGRLTPEELSERLDAAYEARTVGELDALVADLPATGAPAPKPAKRPEHDRMLHLVGLAVLACVTCVGVWFATGADGSFWPKWVILASAIRLAYAAWGELGPGGDAAQRETRQGRGGSLPPAPPAPPAPPPPPELRREKPPER
jgi:hypothetical protein